MAYVLTSGLTCHSVRVIVCLVTRLIASEHALRALLLLSQHGSAWRASEIAEALDISYTGAEKALDILVVDVQRRDAGGEEQYADGPVEFRARVHSEAVRGVPVERKTQRTPENG